MGEQIAISHRRQGVAEQLATFFVGGFTLAAAMVLIVGIFLLVPRSAWAAAYERSPEVKVFSEDAAHQYNPSRAFFAYDAVFMGGGSVAIGDLGKDGINELVTAAGVGGAPHIRTFRLDGSFLTQFYAYGEGMRSGVNVAVGDLDGDGSGEIVTAPRQGGGPQVRVFNTNGEVDLTVGFFAYDEAYHGGVNVAVGDVDGDGMDEIVTGNGVDGASHVRVFDGWGNWQGIDFRPFADNLRGGVSVAVGNVDGGPEEEIITAVQSGAEAWVKVYKYNEERTIVSEWKAYENGFNGGINVAAGDVDGDGEAEVITSVAGHGGPQLLIFEAYGKQIHPGFFAYETEFHSGVNVAAGQTDSSARDEIITLPSKLKPDGRTDVERYVRVDLSEQRLYAYEHGYLINSFLISSGLPATPTPVGEFSIQRKIYSHLYSGPGYYLPNTLYNMQFLPHFYLHGAYWHNNFGHPMSHGCVNISYPNAEWYYNWSEVGDLVLIEY